MTRIAALVVLLGLVAPASLRAVAQKPKTSPGRRAAAPASSGNSQIQKIVREIAAANIEANIKRLVSFQTRHTYSETDSDTKGVGAARRWIKSEMERYSRDSGGRLQVAFDEWDQPAGARAPREARLVNIVATLPGTQAESKDRYFVVSGHYDSRASDGADATGGAPGANDDASGTAAVMEIARVMSRYQFDATLVFLAVVGEEQGLFGSTHWAETAKQKNLNIGGMINNDIIGSPHAESGRIDRTHLRLFAEGVPRSRDLAADIRALLDSGADNDLPTRQLARYIKEVGEKYVNRMTVTVVYRRDRYGRAGDHSPFLERGYPAVRLTEPSENYRHQHQNVRVENGVQYGDLPEFVDFEYVAQVARVNAAGLASLALAPAPPKNVELENRLNNDTVLRWEANKEPDLGGYQIVWRETTEPFWQRKAVVKEGTTYTLKGVSRDDYNFGVQSVDKDGNASIAVYPRPARRRRPQ